jgi:hypothetical protein
LPAAVWPLLLAWPEGMLPLLLLLLLLLNVL